MLAILILSMAVAAPMVKKSIQRDREVETMHRGKQYIRAIQLYYRKFHAYPPNVEALVKTNEIRFLRKRYTDPMTGKDDWKPIQFGQNKAPIAMGFFGQPLGGTGGAVLAGTGPGGVTGASPLGGSSTGGSNSFSGGGSSFSGGQLVFREAARFQAGAQLGGGGIGLRAAGSVAAGSGASGTGRGTGRLAGRPTGTGSTGTGTTAGGSGSDTGTGLGPSGQTFGGGGIIGFSPGADKPSILSYKKKTRLNEWEFTYSPLSDQKMMQGGNTGTTGGGTGGRVVQRVFVRVRRDRIGWDGIGWDFGSGGSSPTAPSAPTSNPPQQ